MQDELRNTIVYNRELFERIYSWSLPFLSADSRRWAREFLDANEPECALHLICGEFGQTRVPIPRPVFADMLEAGQQVGLDPASLAALHVGEV